MTQMENTIEVRSISKRYDQFQAVDNVSFTVGRGRVFGLLGPNGAGKTTTIRMIMNIIAPDSGEVMIMGKPSIDGINREIGYLPEERGLYRKMKVLDQLVFLGEIRGLDVPESKKRANHWLERVGLADRAQKKVEELSKGMQQKIQLIGSIMHEPSILILDEPFSGLDPVNQKVFKDLLSEYRESGRTLVFSTHIMEQAEKLCDDIVLINRSRVVLDGPLAEVKRRFSGRHITIRGRGDVERIQTLPLVAGVNAGAEGQLDVTLADGGSTSEFIRAAASVWDLECVIPHEASLDEIFVQVVGRPIEQEAEVVA